MKTITIECPDCGGTGLYKGFMEKSGEAVVCVRCSGSGAQELRYNEFTGRKDRANVVSVRAGSGTILDNPRGSSWMSYDEFKQKIPAGK